MKSDPMKFTPNEKVILTKKGRLKLLEHLRKQGIEPRICLNCGKYDFDDPRLKCVECNLYHMTELEFEEAIKEMK